MKQSIFAGVLLMALGSTAVFAQEAEKTPKPIKKTTDTLTTEQRNSMASVHEKMAACLRSDKSIDECRTEMRTSCMQMGKDACPMGGMMGGKKWHDKMHHEKMHDHGTQKKDSSSE